MQWVSIAVWLYGRLAVAKKNIMHEIMVTNKAMPEANNC